MVTISHKIDFAILHHLVKKVAFNEVLLLMKEIKIYTLKKNQLKRHFHMSNVM